MISRSFTKKEQYNLPPQNNVTAKTTPTPNTMRFVIFLKSMHKFFSFAPKQKLTKGDIPSQSPIAIILKIKIEYPRIVKEATPFSPTYFSKTKL